MKLQRHRSLTPCAGLIAATPAATTLPPGRPALRAEAQQPTKITIALPVLASVVMPCTTRAKLESSASMGSTSTCRCFAAARRPTPRCFPAMLNSWRPTPTSSSKSQTADARSAS